MKLLFKLILRILRVQKALVSLAIWRMSERCKNPYVEIVSKKSLKKWVWFIIRHNVQKCFTI